MLLPDNIVELVNSSKILPSRPRWDYDSDNRYVVFTAALQVNGSDISGFELRAKISKHHIVRDSLFQLEFAKSGRDRTELDRCQWRPFETHTNKAWGPPGHELGRFYNSSHRHTFEHNFVRLERRMRSGSLPAAIPINPDPTTVSEFIAFCGECFRISNINVVSLPNISADLFWVPK